MAKELVRVAALADSVVDDIETRYEFIEELGSGATSAVYLATRADIPGGVEVALKAFDRARLEEDDVFSVVESEVHALRTLQPHPNIITLVEVSCDEQSLCVVQEALRGGELFELLQSEGALSEEAARPLFAQVVLAVQHMHNHGICHRDLKAENVVLDAAQTTAKVIDFGSSSLFDDGLRGLVATAHYVAPEVVHSVGYDDVAGTDVPYTEGCDLWSLGCLLYVMLSRRLPFASEPSVDDNGNAEAAVLRRVASGKPVSFEPEATWSTVSPAAKDVIRELLTPDPTRRMSLQELKSHEWCADAVRDCESRLPRHLADAQNAVTTSTTVTQSGAGPLAPEPLVEPWRAYLRSHLTRLEAVLSDAATAALIARPLDPLAGLASELAVRAAERDAHTAGGRVSNVGKGVATHSEAAQLALLESVLTEALEAALDVLPTDPLGWIAARVQQMVAQVPGTTTTLMPGAQWNGTLPLASRVDCMVDC